MIELQLLTGGELKAIGTADELKALIPANNIISIKLTDIDEGFVQQAKTLPEVENAIIQNGMLLLL